MKAALAQIDATVGDFKGNIRRIQTAAASARRQGADLAIFPEQCLGGYPALDLWEEPGFLRESRSALTALAKQVREPGLIVGFAQANPSGRGRAAFNAAALLHRGRVLAVRQKTLLPAYDVFDESRYFEPARENKPVPFKGRRLGLTICEDAWPGEKLGGRKLYGVDPVARLARAGAQVLINVSASPFVRGKPRMRLPLMAAHARRWRRPFLYTNLVGATDELIFDGHSMVLDAKGRLCALGRPFAEDLLVIDLESLPAPLPEAPFMREGEEVLEALTLGIKDYAVKCGFTSAVVGLSGGIDSAVVGALAARALGAANVTGIAMPSPYSSEGSLADAKALAENIGIRLLTIPIGDVYESYRRSLRASLNLKDGEVSLAEQNLQSRVRGNILMALSNREGSLLLSTGNKSELSVGYCTLYGDMSGGLAVLADCTKRTVYELARLLNKDGDLIPQASIDKAPSAELKPDQKDQDDLPPYETLDDILAAYVEERLPPEAIAKRGHSAELVRSVLSRVDRAEYKRRQAPPSLKISWKAFGVGRRMPIARKPYFG